MKFSRDQMVQRPFNHAIVDEVDSILIDEARTPLIISGPTDDKSELYISVDALVKQFGEGDYEKDEKQRSVVLTEEGTEKAERLLEEAGLIEGRTFTTSPTRRWSTTSTRRSRRTPCSSRDIDYIVKDGKVIIIDEFTGRMMDGRPGGMGFTRPSRLRKESTSCRKPDARLDHLSEPLPHVPEAVGDDRYRRDRSTRTKKIYNLDVVYGPAQQGGEAGSTKTSII